MNLKEYGNITGALQQRVIKDAEEIYKMKTNQSASQRKTHSKLPWETYCQSENQEDGWDLASKQDGPFAGELERTTAEFIVRAANNFYPLLEACKKALSRFDSVYGYGESGTLNQILINDLEQAIKAAEGGES